MSDCWNFGKSFPVDFQEVQPWNLNLWVYKLKITAAPFDRINEYKHEVIARAVRVQVGQGVSGQLFCDTI